MCAYELAVTAGTESLRIDEVCVCMRARARASERASVRVSHMVCASGPTMHDSALKSLSVERR